MNVLSDVNGSEVQIKDSVRDVEHPDLGNKLSEWLCQVLTISITELLSYLGDCESPQNILTSCCAWCVGCVGYCGEGAC